jgi:predicted nucleic acid-binding protein
VDQVAKFGIEIVSIPRHLISTAAAVSQQTGLLSNDALIVALMREHGLSILASNDADFDRVPGIARYGPA